MIENFNLNVMSYLVVLLFFYPLIGISDFYRCDSDTVVFPDTINNYYRTSSSRAYQTKPVIGHRSQTQVPKRPNEIPIDLVKRLNDITDAKQFFANFVEDAPEEIAVASIASTYGHSRHDTLEIETRFGGPETTIERKSTLSPKPATCQPELRTVGLRDSNDPTLYYFPSCTRVDRCGGCCSHDLLSCQPVTIEYLNFTVIVSQYGGGTKLDYKGKRIITVEQHTKCRCDCIIKPKDCSSLQEYKKDQCRCICTNKDEEGKCTKDSERKLWNPSNCSCQCRETKECSTGYYFDNTVCNCVPATRRGSSVYEDLDQTRYSIWGKH